MKESIKINFKHYMYYLAEDDSLEIEVTHVRKDGSESNCFIPARDITIEEAWLDVVKKLFPGAKIMVDEKYVYPEEEEGETNE